MSGVRGRAAAGCLCVGLVVTLTSPLPASTSPQPAHQGSSAVDADFDGDGRTDLLIGSSLSKAIQVQFGDGDRQRISARSLPPHGTYTLFGFHAVTCDVDADGFSDAVVGAQQADVGDALMAGRVVVFYGAGSGLSPRRVSVLSQSTPGVPGVSESDDFFGGSVECGQLDADRFDDVVVGVVNESFPGASSSGRVVVVPGGADGVVPAHSWSFNQDTRGIPDQVENSDFFGQRLLVEDVTGDGRNELIVTASEGGNGALVRACPVRGMGFVP